MGTPVGAREELRPQHPPPADRRRGYIGFGDQTVAKQSVVLTYLADAVAAGAVVIPRCPVRQVLVENGVTRGVRGIYAGTDNREVPVVVHAPHVVVAAGALESPALLLRSGIGGPAVGKNLALHPSLFTAGIHADDVDAWIGPPQSLVVDEFADGADSYGFVVELLQYAPGLFASALPADSGTAHKEAMEELRRAVITTVLVRDRGAGRVTIDDRGAAVVNYPMSDPADLEVARRAIRAMLELHAASGAQQILPIVPGVPRWHAGDDLDAYADSILQAPMGAGGWTIVAAHQMGTCRMGDDPTTSVANPRGELHDTHGVWIGDASAFPTASGVNPMITIMALARRTAAHLSEALALPR